MVETGRPLETVTPEVTPAVFTTEVQPDWLATMEDVKTAIEDPNIYLIDALTLPNYTGDLITYPRPGHIATALSFPAPDTLDPVSRTVLSPSDLSRMLNRLNLDAEKRVITYCGGGYYGAHIAFILYLMGFENVGLYDGALMEWASEPSNPMEVQPVEKSRSTQPGLDPIWFLFGLTRSSSNGHLMIVGSLFSLWALMFNGSCTYLVSTFFMVGSLNHFRYKSGQLGKPDIFVRRPSLGIPI